MSDAALRLDAIEMALGVLLRVHCLSAPSPAAARDAFAAAMSRQVEAINEGSSEDWHLDLSAAVEAVGGRLLNAVSDLRR